MSIPIILTTSDKTMNILPAMMYCMSKYWPHQEVHILGYSMPEFNVPANMTYHSLGRDEGPFEWSTEVMRWIGANAPQYFIFSTDDMLPITPVDQEMVDWLVDRHCHLGLGRICLWNDVQKRSCQEYPDKHLVVLADPEAAYSVSVVFSVWNRKAFLGAIKPSISPWQFEKYCKLLPTENVIGTRGAYAMHLSHGLFSSNIAQHNWKKCICDCGLQVDPEIKEELRRLIP